MVYANILCNRLPIPSFHYDMASLSIVSSGLLAATSSYSPQQMHQILLTANLAHTIKPVDRLQNIGVAVIKSSALLQLGARH